MVEIKNIAVTDLGAINALLVRAFSQVPPQQGSRSTPLPLCTEKFLRLYLYDTPSACFAAHDNGRLVGVVFGHRWGKLGWLGPLAVSPECQGRGIGKSMVKKTIAHFHDSGCCWIGLETHPNSIKNVMFYSKMGFIPGPLMLDILLKKSTFAKWRPWLPLWPQEKITPFRSHPPRPFTAETLQRLVYSEAGVPQRRRIMTQINHLSEQLDARINLNHLIENLVALNYGDAYLYRTDEESVAYIVLQTGAVAVGEKPAVGRVLVLAAGHQCNYSQLLQLLYDLMQKASCNYLLLRIPAHCGNLLQFFLQNHFAIVHTTVRMYLQGYAEHSPKRGLFLSKWE